MNHTLSAPLTPGWNIQDYLLSQVALSPTTIADVQSRLTDPAELAAFQDMTRDGLVSIEQLHAAGMDEALAILFDLYN